MITEYSTPRTVPDHPTPHANLFHPFGHLLDPARPEGWLCPGGGLSRCPPGAHLLLAAIIWADLGEPMPPTDSAALLLAAGWCQIATNGQVSGQALTRAQYAALRYVAEHHGIDPAFSRTLRGEIVRLAVVDAPPPLPVLPPRLGALAQRVSVVQHDVLARGLARGALAGWLAPDGRLHLCGRYEHARTANWLCGLPGDANDGWQQLERAGWAVVPEDGGVSLPEQGWTQAQLDTMGDLLGETRLRLDWRKLVAASLYALHVREQSGR